MILLGDFNLPTITWLDGSGFCDSSDSASFTFCQCLPDNNLFQLIDSPTRLNNCLDLLLTNICEHIINISVSECESIGVPSDHKAITFDLNFTARTPNDNRQETFNLKKADFEGLRTALRNDPLENYLDTDNDVEHNWTSWKTQLFSKLNAFIPKRKPRKFITPPWIDGEVTHAIRQKKSLWKRGKDKNNPATWERFREKRKKIKYLIRSKRIAFLKNISDSCFSHPNRFWSYFNRLTRRSNIPETIELNGRSHSDARSKANTFNTYFTTVFNADTSTPSNLPSSPYTNDIVSTLEFSHEEVLSSLQNLNSSKTPGPDNLHPRILKECANELAPSLCSIFNKSLRTGKLPSDWKQANITPVFKKGSKVLVPNYRQISLLSIVSKLCERCVLRNLLSKLSHLLTSAQHGFVRGRSCVTQLLSVLHDLGTSLDAGDEVDVVYLDFSKAFDLVPHGRLLHKLSLFGIQGPLHAWFTDYLHSRSQTVAIEGTFSSWVPVTTGVPQGSILGPFLFLLYVNDLPDVLSNSTSIALFADDAKCSRVVRNSDDCTALQQDLNSVSIWSQDWGLSFNKNKCEVLRISRKRNSMLESPTVNPYTINDHQLAVVPSSKDLGVLVNNKLTWDLQISSVVAKANKTLGFLQRHFGGTLTGPAHRRSMYLSLVRSHLSYASEIWAPQSCKTDLKLLESVQRRATRFILNCSKDHRVRPNYKSRLISLNLLPISYWLECRDLCFVYKYMSGSFNVQLEDYIQVSSGRTRSSTDSLNLYPVHRLRTSLFRDSFFNCVVKLWNNLPLEIRKSSSISAFKSRLYKHYFLKLRNVF